MRKRILVLAASAAALGALIAANMAFAAGTSTVTLSSAADFTALAERVNSGDSMEGVEVRLAADVDFSSSDYFEPIGSQDTPFKGTFNGQGHRLNGIKIYKAVVGVSQTYLGIFGCAKGATFKNLTVSNENVSIYTTSIAYEALLCPIMENCTVENCSIQGVVGAESGSSLSMGGVCVSASACTFKNSSFEYSKGTQATDQFSPSYPAAVIAQTASNGTVIENCTVAGKVSGSSSGTTGSVVGTLSGSIMTGCTSTVKVEGSVSSGGYVGGLVGKATSSTISNCRNSGDVVCKGSNKSGSAAGLVGCLESSTLMNCSNSGAVSLAVSISTYDGGQVGEGYTAGLVGLASGNSTISACFNEGAVSTNVTAVRHAYCRAGGLLGKASLCDMSDCYNIGSVSGVATTSSKTFFDSRCQVGGMGVDLDDTCTVKNCYNAGKVTYEFPATSVNEPEIDAVCPQKGATYTDCVYWRGACGVVSESGVALGYDAMRSASSYANWDFASTWRMDADEFGLPVLTWEDSNHAAVIEPDIDFSQAQVVVSGTCVYTGEPVCPQLAVTLGDKELIEDVDYCVTAGTDAGKATAEVEGLGRYVGSVSVEYTIAKANNGLKAKAAKSSVKRGGKVALKVSGVIGKVTYKCSLKGVSVKGGKVVVAKSAKKGTCTVTVKAAGDANHKAASVKVKVKVK